MDLNITNIAQKLIDKLSGEQQKIQWLSAGIAMLHDALVQEHEQLLKGEENGQQHSVAESGETEKGSS